MPLNIDFLQILLHLLNFTLLFAGLYFLLYKPVKQFMQKREDHYKEMQTAADDMLKNAQESQAEYETKLRAIDDEIAAKKRANAIELEKVRREKTEAAEKEAAKILEDAKAEGRAVRDQIVSGARSQITEMVEEIARKTLISEDESTTFDAFLDAAEKDLSEKEAAAAEGTKPEGAAKEPEYACAWHLRRISDDGRENRRSGRSGVRGKHPRDGTSALCHGAGDRKGPHPVCRRDGKHGRNLFRTFRSGDPGV